MKQLKMKVEKFDIALIVLLCFVSCVYLVKYFNKKDIFSNYGKTTGIMTSFEMIGVEDNRYLGYKYYVDGIEYEGSAFVDVNYYDYCSSNIELCKDKKFWVIYSKKDPSNSLIDYMHEIQDIEFPVFPKDLSNFK